MKYDNRAAIAFHLNELLENLRNTADDFGICIDIDLERFGNEMLFSPEKQNEQN